jgi:hypothetical protein
MAEYRPTHNVSPDGIPAWAGPDGSGPPAANLDAGLDVMVVESRGAWSHIVCSNGWEAWVDGRRLVVMVAQPPAQSVQPPAPAPMQPGVASPAWAPRAAAPAPGAVPGARSGFAIGPGQIVALVGGALVFLSGWLRWIHVGLQFRGRSFSASYSAYKLPAHFLLDSHSNQGGLNLGILIAFFGVACIAAALIGAANPQLRILSVIVGAVVLIIVLLFLVQARYLVNAFNDQVPSGAANIGYFETVRFGAYLALLGAVGSLVGGIIGLTQRKS